MNDDPHALIRRDVREMGAMLGNVLREQGGEELYRSVEEVRRLAMGAALWNVLT
jgi:phosphoenolpyruvate carboxylase